MESVEFLNRYSGAIMAVLTMIYTIATIALVHMNQKTIKEMQNIQKKQMLPQVVISFGIRRKGLCCLILENYGASIAKEVLVKFTDECEKNIRSLQDENNKKIERLSSGQMVLAPKQAEYYCFCGMVGNLDKLGATPLKGWVKYTNTFNETVMEEFCIDVLSYEGALLYGVDVDEITSSIDGSSRKITDAIKGCKSELSKLSEAKTEK